LTGELLKISGRLEPFGHLATYIRTVDGVHYLEILTPRVILVGSLADVTILVQRTPILDSPQADSWHPMISGKLLLLPALVRPRTSTDYIVALVTRFHSDSSSNFVGNNDPTMPPLLQAIPFTIRGPLGTAVGTIYTDAWGSALIVGEIIGELVSARFTASGDTPLTFSWTIGGLGTLSLTLSIITRSITLSDPTSLAEFTW
jgi:hypothetical protein